MTFRAIDTIGLDADDTLWHNEIYFQSGHEKLAALVAPFASRETLGRKMLEIEHRNLKIYGYGIKGFTLSMIEAAIELSDDTIPSNAIRQIIENGRDMLAFRIDPLPGVTETLQALRGRYRVVVITKGDLLDQEAKIARSGLGDMIDDVHIVSEKTPAVYTRIFGGPEIEAGAYGIHVPYHVTWAHEHADAPVQSDRFHRMARLDELLEWLERTRG
jgi:putative hydrolase of the HAD superfamily